MNTMIQTQMDTVVAIGEQVLCIVVTARTVQSFLVSYSSLGVRVLERSPILHYENLQKLVISTDESLRELGKQSEFVDRVIFGVAHAWIGQTDVVKEKQVLLQKITDELTLKPEGFVDSLETLIQKQLLLTPQTSELLIEIDNQQLSVAALIHGDVRGIETVGRSDDITADVAEAFARFAVVLEVDGMYLPSKIKVTSLELSEVELSEYQQQLIEVQWDDRSRFLQQPSIEIISKEIFAETIAVEAGNAAGIASGLKMQRADGKNADVAEGQDTFNFSLLSDEELESSRPSSEKPNKFSEDRPVDSATLDEDNLDTQVDRETTIENERATAPEVTSFGVPISSKQLAEMHDFHQDAAESQKNSQDKLNEKKSLVSRMTKFLMQLSNKKRQSTEHGQRNVVTTASMHPTHVYSQKNLKKYIAVGVVTGILTLVGLAFVGAIYFTNVTISIVPEAKQVSKDVTLTLDTEAQEPNAESFKIPAKSSTVSLEESFTAPTTGTTLVGDPAKGQVEIVNKTESEKVLQAGTLLRVGEIEFELDEEVTLPAAEATEDGDEKVTKFGKKTVSVTARKFGSEGNIKKDTEVIVASFATSTYVGKSIIDFSGGEEREVAVVSEKDIESITEAATERLIEKANTQGAESISGSTRMVPISSITISDKKLSREVGDEASELTIDLRVDAQMLTYNVEDLKLIAQEVLSNEVPEGYTLADTDPEILSQPSSSEDATTIQLKGNVRSRAIPVFNTEELHSTIAGKSLSEASDALISLDTVASATITLEPAAAQVLYSKVPNTSKRVKVNVQAQQK